MEELKEVRKYFESVMSEGRVVLNDIIELDIYDELGEYIDTYTYLACHK